MKQGLILIVLICGVLPLSAQNDSLSATEYYNDGAYSKAVDNYQEILNNGEHSAALYYNLGNCYYKLNQIAPSIYYYEKALLLKPNDREVKNNLAFAQQMTLDAIEPLPESGISRIYNSVIGLLSFEQWAYLAVVLVILFVLAYLFFYYLRYASHKRIAFTIALVSVIMACISVVFAFFQRDNYLDDKPAIVFAPETRVMSEPNNRSSEVFVLHEGTKVSVIDELEDYNRISLADGKSGWIPAEDIKMLKDF